jgi:ABC-type branched-subunit amino acid transport system permease subunit
MSAVAPAAATPLSPVASQRRLPWVGLAVLLIAACALPFLVSNYRTFQFTLVLVYAIALLGLNILTGYNGQISLGHGAFYAIGAYVAAILMDRRTGPRCRSPAPCASSSASCSGCRHCGWKATISRSPPSPSA